MHRHYRTLIDTHRTRYWGAEAPPHALLLVVGCYALFLCPIAPHSCSLFGHRVELAQCKGFGGWPVLAQQL
jgi:hypothetical protein